MKEVKNELKARKTTLEEISVDEAIKILESMRDKAGAKSPKFQILRDQKSELWVHHLLMMEHM